MGKPLDDAKPLPSIRRVCYDGTKWVEAWNLTIPVAYADPTIGYVEFADGSQVPRYELEKFLSEDPQ